MTDEKDKRIAELEAEVTALRAYKNACERQEPRGYTWRFDDGDLYECASQNKNGIQRECYGYDGDVEPLYTHPAPLRALTDEDIYRIDAAVSIEKNLNATVVEFARAIERHLKGE